MGYFLVIAEIELNKLVNFQCNFFRAEKQLPQFHML